MKVRRSWIRHTNHFKSNHLRLWIRHWLETKRLIYFLEIQNYPQQRSTQPNLIRPFCAPFMYCLLRGVSHDIMPSNSIANIIQLTFQTCNPARPLSSWTIWGSVARWQSRHSVVICFVSRTLTALLEQRLRRWKVRGKVWHVVWNWFPGHPSDLQTWQLLNTKLGPLRTWWADINLMPQPGISHKLGCRV